MKSCKSITLVYFLILGEDNYEQKNVYYLYFFCTDKFLQEFFISLLFT
ncbi:hypothetical protein BAPKO_2511 (plasmid) [Borreliella afzelii PKo]|nr:hypothetical protein BAPKO_2511 [Borreliella afzelii PKo]